MIRPPRIPGAFNHLALSTLARRLTCPRCHRTDSLVRVPHSVEAVHECVNQRCRQHWYAIYLRAGAVEPQLIPIFSAAIARENMRLWQLPATLREPMFWQLALSRNQFAAHGALSSRGLLAAVNRFVRQRITLAGRQPEP